MPDQFEYDVFLSHSSKDNVVVRELAEQLRDDGLRVWLDDWMIQPGDHWPSKIEEGLESSRTLILCVSDNALESEWVTLERHTALFRDPTNRQRRFVPLRLDDCEIKPSLQQYAFVDWREKDHREYLRLVAMCARKQDVSGRSTEVRQELNPAKKTGRWRKVGIAFSIAVVLLVGYSFIMMLSKNGGEGSKTDVANVEPDVGDEVEVGNDVAKTERASSASPTAANRDQTGNGASSPPSSASTADTGWDEPWKKLEDSPDELTAASRPMVIVRRDTSIFAMPNDRGRVLPVSMYQFLYMLKQEGTNQWIVDGFCWVADGPDPTYAIGWIRKSDVILWMNRQILLLNAGRNGSPAALYSNQSELEKAYRGEQISPLSVIKSGSQNMYAMPIIDEGTILAASDSLPAYRVAMFESEIRPQTEIVKERLSIEIVFLIDTTYAMHEFVEEVRRAVLNATDKLAQLKNERIQIRLGLVENRGRRDPVPEDWYQQQVLCDLNQGRDYETFRRSLMKLETSTTATGTDASADVISGLRMALEESRWDRAAAKHIVLIGNSIDLSGATDESVNAVIALARPRSAMASANSTQSITIHAIDIGADKKERIGRDHLFKILGHGEGIEGAYIQLDVYKRGVIEGLVDDIAKSLESLSHVTADAGTQVDPSSPDFLVNMINASADVIDKKIVDGVICKNDPNGRSQVDPYVLVRYEDLRRFDAGLEYCVAALEQPKSLQSADVARLLHTMQIGVASMSSGETLSADTPLSVMLANASRVPVRTPLLKMSVFDLAIMDDGEFESWMKSIEAVQAVVRAHLKNDRIWFPLRAGTSSIDKHALIRLPDLP